MASTLPHKDDMPPTYCPEKAQRLTEPAPKRTMSSRRLAVTFFLCFMVAYGLAAAISPRYRVPCHYGHHEQVPEGSVASEEPQGESAEGALSTLLNSVSPDSLHRMLHDYFPDRYQHGVYETDRQAVEAVHADNPAIVATIAQIAKRQSNSTTTTTSPPRTSTTSQNPTTTTRPTTTSEESRTTPTTTSRPPASSTTRAPDTTDSPTTAATPTRRSSSLVTSTFTSTQSNGDVTVVTATSFVEVGPSATGTTGTGSLQTGNAAPGGPIPLPAWAGIIMGGLLLI